MWMPESCRGYYTGGPDVPNVWGNRSPAVVAPTVAISVTAAEHSNRLRLPPSTAAAIS